MSQLPLTYYSNPILDRRAAPVIQFDETLRNLVFDMFETMYAAPGVGLAAPQIGVPLRLFVMDCSSRRDLSRRLAIANPEIVFYEGRQRGHEGCLSIPGYSFPVQRPSLVVIRGQDLNGEEIVYEGHDLEARCLFHETDHCDGILYIDRLTPLRKREILRSLKKKIKANEWPPLPPWHSETATPLHSY